MKIQCDVCEKAPATVVCCADEAALCAKCDGEVHAANKLASKHQRLPLHCLSGKPPKCDICQLCEREALKEQKKVIEEDTKIHRNREGLLQREKTAFIFCVEDRALFCEDCDEPIHSTNSLSRNHQRFLATGIGISPTSSCSNEIKKRPTEPPNPKKQPVSPNSSSYWTVDDFLCFSEFEIPDKKEKLEFGELEWLSEMGIFGEHISRPTMATAEVPELPRLRPSNTSYRPAKLSPPSKKPRIDTSEEYFTVPDLG